MNTWNKLGLIVTPKAHIFKEHNIESMQDLNGMCDKTEYFIDLYHQDIACKDRRTQGIKDY